MSRAYESRDPFDWSLYFMWLCEKIDVSNDSNYGYFYCLVKTLMNREFYSSIVGDQNRIGDAKDLRAEFALEQHQNIFDAEDVPVSVLEVLIALSVRIERDIVGEPGNDRPDKWFWIMMSNLGLTDNTDDIFDMRAVNRTITVWLNHMYESNGSGGIFPLKDPYGDQRKIELWSQMQQYLSENFEY